MRPVEDLLPPPTSLANFSLPVPIISVRSPSSSVSSSPPSSALPASRVPLRGVSSSRAETAGVVLGTMNGQVRRMRSVLDMRLGAMAGMPVVLQEIEAKRNVQLDVFGLEVPNTNVKEHEDESNTWNQTQDLDRTQLENEPCSVVLAESPSRLDLSALMC